MVKMKKASFYALNKDHDPIGAEIPVMFNPSEYDYAVAQKYTNVKTGQPDFIGVELQPFNVTLFFDTYETQKDVRKEHINRLEKLLVPSISGRYTKRPPECMFTWGNFTIIGVLQKLDQKFTMFLSNGTPVRATVTVTIQPTLTDKEIVRLSGKEACRKHWTVKSGDRLDLIAYQTLQDPAQWRMIAEINHIKNPLEFPGIDDIGTLLIIPD